jgi:hypothetical protein
MVMNIRNLSLAERDEVGRGTKWADGDEVGREADVGRKGTN